MNYNFQTNSLQSQQRTAAAQEAGKFSDEIFALQTKMNVMNKETKEVTEQEVTVIKDLNLDSDIPESTFLRALRILNLNAIVEGLDDASDNILNINRASGKIILGKKRALIESPIVFETDEATLKWVGEVIKDSKGELDKLNLDLSLRLKISENIPWYAAIFGGIPAIAGGVVFENIFEDAIEDISTINFQVKGTIDEPKIDRLN